MEQKQEPSKTYKEDIHESTPLTAYINYAIFGVGAKFKTVASASGFQAHMCREKRMEIPNADASKKYLNQYLRGDNDVVRTLEHFLSDCVPWKKNQVCARELMMTASKRFFKDMPEEKLQLWIDTNVKFMQQEFGDNFLFAICHLDESVPHIHALVACKFYDHDKQLWKVQHYKYFNGKEKLREWQDKYSEHMQKSFPELQRGCKLNKSKHNEIQRLYGILEGGNLDISEEDAKTKLQLQDIKFKRLEGTLQNVKTINNHLVIENSELMDLNKEFKEENTIMAKAIKDLMLRKHIPQNELDLSLAKVQTQSTSKKVGS